MADVRNRRRALFWALLVGGPLILGLVSRPTLLLGAEPFLNEPPSAAHPNQMSQFLPVEMGRSLFERNCAHCHGDDARGDEGPSLYDLARSDARIKTIIREGIRGEMPKFGAKFKEVEIDALVAYLRTLKS